MKPRNLRLLVPCFIALLLTQNITAQKSRTYAVTGVTKGDLNWTVIRQIDLSTGAVVKDIYLPSTSHLQRLDARTGVQLQNINIQDNATLREYNPSVSDGGLIAATALDAKNNRLYFTPLMGNDLRYIDLNSNELKIYYVRDQMLRQFTPKEGEADNITRMAFSSDGIGYALTNDGNHLIQFTSGKDIAITDLGSLKDGKNNGKTTIHEEYTNWGGDMVADAFGNLYLFTVKSNVFKINPKSLVADFIGTIKNLPTDYSVNGAAVNDDGNVVISSSLQANAYYKVNLSTLDASQINNDNGVFNASDFANENLAFQNKKDVTPEAASDKFVTVYPNPVVNNQVMLYFNKPLTGKFNIAFNDVNGKKIAAELITFNAQQTHKMLLPSSTASGAYMISVVDEHNKTHTAKLIVQ